MPKAHKKLINSDQEQEIQDNHAWGHRKEAYYQQGEDQYSQSSEEEQAALEEYQRQLQQLGNHDVYELPQQDDQEGYQEDQLEEEDKEKGLSQQYLTKEIARTAKLGLGLSEEPDSQIRRLLQTHIQAYLMTLISLRELKISYVEYHPLFSKMIQMKQTIAKLKKLMETSTNQEDSNEELEEEGDEQEEEINDGGEEEEFEMEQEGEESDQRPTRRQKPKRETKSKIQEGLKIYEETKKQHDSLKAAAKEQKRQERDANKKPAFLEVKDNQGRLANETILKNKGLMKRRLKKNRNSRVVHRRKFEKSKSKLRAKGQFIRQNPGRDYEGERNIRIGKKASRKIVR